MADDRYETLLANYRNAWAGLHMIRDAVETLGPPGVLPSGEAVISLYGPEPIHEAQAIVDALAAILGDDPDPGTAKPQPRRWPRMRRPESRQLERRSTARASGVKRPRTMRGPVQGGNAPEGTKRDARRMPKNGDGSRNLEERGQEHETNARQEHCVGKH
jgi:hypothetical protein